jgi:hypothetical protein
MTNSAINMYELSLDQCTSAIIAGGNKRTILMQGHMGTGKSATLTMLDNKLPEHKACYFDCTTKDLGDLLIPKLKDVDGNDYVTFATNEELGLHLQNKKIALMIDEIGKSNPAVFNGLLRLIYERKIGSYTMHPDSVLFATTNLGAEGVGDIIPPHGRNRITVVKVRKPDHMELIEYGINNKWDSTILGWVKDNPHLLQTFEDVKKVEDNPYIFHPQSTQTSFVTPRSLECASDWLKVRDQFDDHTLTGLLMGTIGERGAMDLMAFVRLADDLPSLESIKKDPKNAKVPTTASAICMVVYRTLANLEKDWINAWLDYMLRLDKEAQGLFANGVRSEKYSKRAMVMTNAKFTKWAMDNNYMFVADKK